MSRHSPQWLRFVVSAVVVMAAASACAPRGGTVPGRGPAPVAARAPACDGGADDGALFWAADARRSTRRLAVRLEVLPEASAAWRLDGRSRLEEALLAWNRAGLPVRLARAEGGDPAPIRVSVVRRLPLDAGDAALAFRAGVTHLRYDARGAISQAQVLIAEQTPRGEPYSALEQVATLMHELGHALGIPHSDHPFALMSARTVAVSLTPHDVALARAVYARHRCGGAAPVTAARND